MVTVVAADPACAVLGHSGCVIVGALEFSVKLTVMVCDRLAGATPLATTLILPV
jgi:hypothetical protein